MKKIKSIQVIALSIASLTIVFSSCKKEDDTTTTPVAGNGTLAFHLHTNIDSIEVGDDIHYGDTIIPGGRSMTLSKAQLYISGIQLVKQDGSVIDGPDVNTLQVVGTEEYTIGSVPAGNYKSVKFKVGLNSTTNSTIPSSSNSILNDTSMWFDHPFQTADGFVFVNLQGTIDTATAPSGGNPLIPFSLKIGTNAHLITVSMPDQAFTVTPGNIAFVHITTDYLQLINGLQLNVNSNLQVNTAADNSSSNANQIANNIASMFSYEE